MVHIVITVLAVSADTVKIVKSIEKIYNLRQILIGIKIRGICLF